MQYDPDLAADIANRINEIMRSLPADTQPVTVVTGLCAVMARLISALREEDRELMLQEAITLIREHSSLRPN